MITKMSHTSLFVLDQDKAYDFYVNKLGFRVHTDVVMTDNNCEEGARADKEAADTGYRWLTLNPPEQPDLEIILMPIQGFDPESQQAIRLLLEKGLLGAGVLYTADCRGTYEELKAKGVEFKCPPTEQFYGIECIISDGCGNWFSMTQPKVVDEPVTA